MIRFWVAKSYARALRAQTRFGSARGVRERAVPEPVRPHHCAPFATCCTMMRLNRRCIADLFRNRTI
eukprot:11177559-Lingulodinium_polyedra.AAC.1